MSIVRTLSEHLQAPTHKVSDRPSSEARLTGASRFFVVIGLASAMAFGMAASALTPTVSAQVPSGHTAYMSHPTTLCAGTASDCH